MTGGPYFTRHETLAERRAKPEVALRNFHSRVKAWLLGAAAPGGRLLDLAAGRGADCRRYPAFREVVALDIDATALAELRRRVPAQRVATVTADFTRPLPPGLGAFGCVSTMFAAHYACRTPGELAQFVGNVAGHLRPGGVFVGLDLDGDSVAAALGPGGRRSFTDWARLTLTGERLAVEIQSIGDGPKDEWLLRWDRFRAACAAAGMRLCSTGMLDPGGRVPQPDLGAFSRLHRWWIFEAPGPK